MKRAAWILAIFFGLTFLGATLLNADLVAKTRKALSGSVIGAVSSAVRGRYHAMVILPDTDDSFFTGLLEGIRAESEASEVATQVFRYSSLFTAEAEQYFEIALGSKLDGVIMYAPAGEPVGPRAAAAARNGVTFVPVGTDTPADAPEAFIGCSSLLQGLDAGRLVNNLRGTASRVGIILPSDGTGDPEGEPLYRGIASAIASRKGSAILAAARTRPGPLAGEEAAANMLREYPSLNVIVCSNARDTEGAAQVVIDMNKVGQVLIIGSDETPGIGRLLEKGVVAASVVRDSRRIGVEAVRAFLRKESGSGEPGLRDAGFHIIFNGSSDR